MRSVEEIDNEIRSVENELKDVHGGKTEVYARIVGYYRSVNNWNKGKRDEFNHRKMFETRRESGADKVREIASDIIEFCKTDAQFATAMRVAANGDEAVLALLA